jgi:Flp pilus assembly protein TadG
MYQLICRLRKYERGQSLVELALVLPILIILLFGILEFGRVFHSYLVITNAAREGARHGIICRDVTGIKQKVLDSSPGINLEPGDITVNPSTGLTTGVPLTVSVEYNLAILTPVLSEIIPNPVPISATSTMRVE